MELSEKEMLKTLKEGTNGKVNRNEGTGAQT